MKHPYVDVSMRELAKDLTLEIRISGMRAFQIRAWIAIKLIQLAAFVFPANVNVHMEGMDET